MNLPDIAAIEPFDHGVPFDMLAEMRRASPVWIPEPASEHFGGGPGYWAVGRHADVTHVAQNPQWFSSWLGGTTVREQRPKDLEQLRLMMQNMDPPRHSKMRKIVNRAFTPQVINQLQASIEAHAREVVDAICEKGEIDFLTEAAAEMPLLVLADILGVPAQDRHKLFEWTNALIAFEDPDSGFDRKTFRELVLEMFAYASARTLEKRAQPTGDVWSLVVNAEFEGEQLSKAQLDRFFQLLMVAGNETTRNLIAHGLMLLSTYPEQRRKLMADLSLLPSAIEEMLRFAPPVIQFRRTASVDTELNGRRIRAGDKVLICFAAANRDETVFDRPDEFDITRQPNPHLAFGNGTHFCIGANLARLEARVFFTELLTRLPDIEVSGPAIRARSSFINGFKHMPARFTPAPRKGPLAHAPSPSAPLMAASAPPDEPPRAAPTDAPATAPRHGTPMLVLYGSNFGTAEEVAHKLAVDARGHGFDTSIDELDAYSGQLPTSGYLLIVCATYNGTPPDNARAFIRWLDGASGTPLAGLRYSVFGCGNSDWASTFQAIPQRIDAGLARLGAQRVHPRGEGDAKDDFDGCLDAWVQPTWGRIGNDLGIEFGKPVAGALYGIEVLETKRARAFTGTFDARPMRVAVNHELRTGPVQEIGSTRHIEIELPADVSYRTGDHLGVLPRNDETLVQRAAARFGLAPETVIRITARTHRETFLPVNERITLGELLADYVELQNVATRAQIRTLAAYCECPFTRPRLEALAADGQTGENGPYRAEVLSRRRSVLDLLDTFAAIQLPLDAYLEMLPPLSPRFYSIASSPLHAPHRCSLTVSVVAGPARSGQGRYEGVCSNHLARRNDDGDVVHAFVRDPQTAFRLPADPRTPIIMIGPGTGLAPFRGFLQERAAQRAGGQAIGEAMLFFGCRHPEQDYLYRSELQAFARDGITELHVAFSRLKARKIYVQDLLREQCERVWSLLARGAMVYVCGDASHMEPDVRSALADVTRMCGGMNDEEARAHVDSLVSGGRYLVDVWATG